jgi:8-oxo-dGTP pyrophosphatase MutT (NUDIX family)
MLRRTKDFVSANPACFDRTLSIGHVTGSAWIVSADRRHALLTHHRKLDMWVQLGGHSDGDPDTCAVATREALEESGLASIVLASPSIFDVDVHRIPERGAEPAHFHYDIRYLFEASRDEPFVVSEESLALAWVEIGKLVELGVDESVLRMAAKTVPAA